MKQSPRKELIKRLKPYWKAYREIRNGFLTNVTKLEENMKKDLNIDNIEFAWVEGNIVGIGCYPSLSFKLIHDSELE